jgi:hypothetical protein
MAVELLSDGYGLCRRRRVRFVLKSDTIREKPAAFDEAVGAKTGGTLNLIGVDRPNYGRDSGIGRLLAIRDWSPAIRATSPAPARDANLSNAISTSLLATVGSAAAIA